MAQSNRDSESPPCGDAWREAQQYGIDTFALLANREKTVLERIRNHDRAMDMALALRQAMGRPRDKESLLQPRAIRQRRKEQGAASPPVA